MKLVAKFGGSVLRDAEGYSASAKVVKECVGEGYKVVVVVSAMKGVTDSLLKVSGSLPKDWKKYVEALKRRHERVLQQLGSSERWFKELEKNVEELKNVLWALYILREHTPRTRDFVLSFGERLSTILMSAALEREGLNPIPLTPEKAGIFTDENYNEAVPLYDVIEREVPKRLEPFLEEDKVPVVTGFLGSTLEGSITTLGRGGSDLTATILGSSLKADEVRLYTDIDGIKTGNPKEFPDAVTIRELSVEEAIELAHLGAKRLHPRTFEPVLRRHVDVRVLSLYDPKGNNTLISHGRRGPMLKAVALLNGLAIITVKGVGMVGTKGVAATVMESVTKVGANIYAISQPVSEISISIAVKSSKADLVSNAIRNALEGKGISVETKIKDNVTAVSVVGRGLEELDFVGNVLSLFDNKPVLMVSKGPLDQSLTVLTTNKASREIGRKIHEKIVEEMMQYYGEAK
ncbi:aspartate kinase [Ignicoccus hospitalis]|uniref:Aspartokinase n=1 Tax=Ignicoccus hospitalis (strain KIN4/I / DSM 18386 / JCM 14125) TaxID=453591 RepID=A8A8Y1_IGNH4|nr:aspartate kinase [Ignicoccus hospitalis]ABU81383.1 aspartate kinase [Ignicoccus hospitalis KIN4/I]HIH90311.1 aspartate kinase [Desulfurococcaceae archaeon]